MNSHRWAWFTRLTAALAAPTREPAEHARLILTLQRSVVIPTRLIAVAMVLYHLFNSPWLSDAIEPYGVVFETIRTVLVSCAAFMLVGAAVFYVVRRFPVGMVQWLVFVLGLADGIFLAGVTVLTGGFDSIFYWVFPVLIVINSLSIPLATPQIVLNLLLCVFYLLAGHIETGAQPELELPGLNRTVSRRAKPSRIQPEEIASPRELMAWIKQAPAPVATLFSNSLSPLSRSALDTNLAATLPENELRAALAADLNDLLLPKTRYVPSQQAPPEVPELPADPYVLRVAVLLLLTFCCYGVQVLTARQRRAEEEREEFLVRTAQLHSAGRLAAEVAHQIKNPLAIINNVTFSLQKSLRAHNPAAAEQIDIIREEVTKADLVITQIMGYAQLSEGRVEKIEVVAELDQAIAEIFPPAATPQIKVHRRFDDYFPPVMMHRRHFTDTVSNLLQNARDALGDKGNVFVVAKCLRDYSIEISIRDDGPGIPPDRLASIFEAYYTTKERGTGLGLALVKHNVELYGGTITVDSTLGHGARFVLQFPAKTLMKLSS